MLLKHGFCSISNRMPLFTVIPFYCQLCCLTFKSTSLAVFDYYNLSSVVSRIAVLFTRNDLSLSFPLVNYTSSLGFNSVLHLLEATHSCIPPAGRLESLTCASHSIVFSFQIKYFSESTHLWVETSDKLICLASVLSVSEPVNYNQDISQKSPDS